MQAIIADKVHDTAPEGTVGPIWEGLQDVPSIRIRFRSGVLAFKGEPINPKTTYSQPFNLQVQQLIGHQAILFIGYAGSNVRHAQTSINTNTVSTVTPPATNVQSITIQQH